MSTRIAGLVADLLMRTCNAISVERQQFMSGSRYMVRFSGDSNVEVHLVDKDEKLFAEFWINTYATPIMIIEYMRSNTEPYNICREICILIRIMNESILGRKKQANIKANQVNSLIPSS
ncbi:MAG: hypothetical protein TU36_001635 [Vulcanisaeta sp. AZ3]|nr:MAG: hypothetical protein TU36_05260 [Vulcanisaeta sp. AZ3]